MNRNLCLIVSAAILSACASSPSAVRITRDEPVSAQPKAAPQAKTEMVFYNGKTYNVGFTPMSGGTYLVTVAGMSAAQAKDANGLSTSAFHHFTCKDSQKTKLLAKPSFANGRWSLTARCG